MYASKRVEGLGVSEEQIVAAMTAFVLAGVAASVVFGGDTLMHASTYLITGDEATVSAFASTDDFGSFADAIVTVEDGAAIADLFTSVTEMSAVAA